MSELIPAGQRAIRDVIDDFNSGFLAGFTTAKPAPSYLLCDVGVTWTRANAPTLAVKRAMA